VDARNTTGLSLSASMSGVAEVSTSAPGEGSLAHDAGDLEKYVNPPAGLFFTEGVCGSGDANAMVGVASFCGGEGAAGRAARWRGVSAK
jgi:hypothetical protein